MSTVRSIERRLYVRRQADRDLTTQYAVAGGEVARHMEWNGVWSGYMTFMGLGILLLSFVWGTGFSALNPLNGSSWTGVGAGTLAWSAVVLLISLFVGSWVAGRTPRTSKRHGIMRAITLWGMVLLSLLLFSTWVASSAAMDVTSGLSATSIGSTATSNPALQNALTMSGINLTADQMNAVSSQLASGDKSGAAATLANDANINSARANTILNTIPAAPVASGAAQAVKHGGGSLTWGIFWIALIGFGCAIWGGSMGGGGNPLRRSPRHSPQATA